MVEFPLEMAAEQDMAAELLLEVTKMMVMTDGLEAMMMKERRLTGGLEERMMTPGLDMRRETHLDLAESSVPFVDHILKMKYTNLRYIDNVLSWSR